MDTPHRTPSRGRSRESRRTQTGPAHLVIGQSTIDSEGVYTTAPIRKGELVAEYTGPRLTAEEADEIYDDHPRTYLFGLTDGKHVIDGEGVAAFINHSCDPNCEVDEVEGRVFITAIREIAAGEEITYDYNLYDGDLDDLAPCLCGSSNCRGSMYSEREMKRRATGLERRRQAAKKQKGPVRPRNRTTRR
jgi:uncharacterized protein